VLDPSDLHACDEVVPLTVTGVEGGNTSIGVAYLRYEVREVDDVRNLESKRSYLVTCTQRLVVPGVGPPGFSLAPPTTYDNYPAVLTVGAKPTIGGNPLPAGWEARVVDYFPRTLNTAISTSLSNQGEKETSSTTEHTSGSSTAQTNSYDVSASLGFFGEELTGGVSASAGHATTTTTDSSDSRGRGLSASAGITQSVGMSIKDWASFGALDAAGVVPTWVWGQEYPWNVLAFHGKGAVTLPRFVVDRLCEKPSENQPPTQVFPPSELSLFGIDFTAQVRWLVTPAVGAGADETLAVTHAIEYFTASHGISGNEFVASMQGAGAISVTGPKLDLPLLGLEPIAMNGVDNGAVVSFGGSFLSPPAASTPFRARSASNNVYVTGEGFDALSGPDAPLTANLASGEAKLEVKFKMVNPMDGFALFLKHWKTSPGGCVLTAEINGDESAPVVRHVDAQELGEGSDNVTVIVLRSTDHREGEYYDYLLPGLNTISIGIASSKDGPGAAGYALRAIAIG
jgi:hypothetical protein